MAALAPAALAAPAPVSATAEQAEIMARSDGTHLFCVMESFPFYALCLANQHCVSQGMDVPGNPEWTFPWSQKLAQEKCTGCSCL